MPQLFWTLFGLFFSLWSHPNPAFGQVLLLYNVFVSPFACMFVSTLLSRFKPATPRHGFVDQDDLNTHHNTGTTRQALGAAEVSRHTSRYPSPLDLNYFWGFGSMALVCLILQLVSGIILAMHYVAHVDLAFASIEHIMRNVNGG